MTESDGVDDVVEGTIRVAVTAAMAVAERRARQREAEFREASKTSTEAWQQTVQRHRAQRNIAGGQLMMTVGQPGWLDKAKPDELQWALETAQTWREYDTRIEEHAKTIEEKLRGIDGSRSSVAGEDLGVRLFAVEEAAARAAREGPAPVARVKALTEAEGQARFELRQKFGADWADRTDLPEKVTVSTFENEADRYHSVPVQPLAERERAQRAADQADLAANLPLLRDPPAPVAGLPSVEEMMAKLQPDAAPAAFGAGEHRARLDRAGVTDRAATEAVVLAGGHQLRPTAEVPAAKRSATPRPKKPARGKPVAERDQHRGR